LSLLSEDEIDQVHEKTLEILQDPGVSVQSEAALGLLELGGAKTDRKSMRACIPESLVRETLQRLPKTIRLSARNPKQDMIAPRTGPVYMATNGTAVYMTALDSGAKRTTTAKDLKDFTVLADAMEALDYVWPVVAAHDAPAKSHALVELTTSLLNTTKHVQGEALSAKEARAEIEVGAAIAGGMEELAKRPLFSVVQCPICPLEFEKGSIEATMEFARAGIPVVSMSMALMGMTSPVTLASTLAIVNAENLASFAISQMTKKGAPVVYSSDSTSPNMKTGEIHYGALEEFLIASATAQMAKHYGAVCMVGGFGVGYSGETPGIHMDPTELLFSSMTTATETDFGSGIGGLDRAKGASLEQVVIDCDLWEVARELRRVVGFDDGHFALDLIRSVGPGGTFLQEAHTLKNMKKELFLPTPEKAGVLGTYRYDRDRTEFVRSAKERVTKILTTHVPEPLDPTAKADVDRILEKHQR
jgi:trimethylamine--corrinoid protein Co-methyltransferase